MEGAPHAALRELRLAAHAIELEPGVNVLVTGHIDAGVAREIAEACRSSRAIWSNVPDGSPPGVARITRSELELRAARAERMRAPREAKRDADLEPRIAELRTRLAEMREQTATLEPELADTRARLGHESDLRDGIAVACDLVEFAMLDDDEGNAHVDDDALERLALEWDLFVATRTASVAHNRESIANARRALDAVTARQAISGTIGTIDADTMDTIQRLHQRHQEATQLLETSRRNQRQERARELEEAAAAERAALRDAGLSSYSDFLMLRVRSPKNGESDERLQAELAGAQRALQESTEFARASLEQHEAEEIDLRARAATLLGRLPAADVAADLRDAHVHAHATPQEETPTALVELAALCRQADLNLGPDPVATVRAWLRRPSELMLNEARLDAELERLERACKDAQAELDEIERPDVAPAAAAEGVESVAGAIRGLLTRGALVPNTTRSVDIDPPVITGLRDAITAIDRDERGGVPLLLEYPWEGESDAVVGRMLSVFREAAPTRQVIVLASSRYARPVADVHWIDAERPAPEDPQEPRSDEAPTPRRWASSLG